MQTLVNFFVCTLILATPLTAQHVVYFTNGHSGKASAIEFKAKTVLIKSFDNPRAPLQEVAKKNIDRIFMDNGTVLGTGDILRRQSPANQITSLVERENQRLATDYGLPRPVQYEWSNFLGSSVTLAEVRHDSQNTILTFMHRRSGLGASQFIISSATYLYNRQDIREAYRLINAGKFDLDVPMRFPAGVDSLQISLCFERVRPGLEEINFKSFPIATGSLGGPVGGYLISRIALTNPLMTGFNQDIIPDRLAAMSKGRCLTCGNLGMLRCPNCLGEGLLTITERPSFQQRTITRQISCPVCQGAGRYLCPNRPNHSELP